MVSCERVSDARRAESLTTIAFPPLPLQPWIWASQIQTTVLQARLRLHKGQRLIQINTPSHEQIVLCCKRFWFQCYILAVSKLEESELRLQCSPCYELRASALLLSFGLSLSLSSVQRIIPHRYLPLVQLISILCRSSLCHCCFQITWLLLLR